MTQNFEATRYKLIEQQIRPWNVPDLEVLDAIKHIHREQFVAPGQESLAFMDTQLPLPGASHPSQKMMEPKMEARILQALKPHSNEWVLEVGTGSGYMAALLGAFAKKVTTVDIDPAMVNFAKTNLAKAYISNVTVEEGDAYTGWGDQYYDVICVSGSMPTLYEGLKQQLAIGGRLFAIIGQEPLLCATLVTRQSATQFTEEVLFETSAPALHSAKVRTASFSF